MDLERMRALLTALQEARYAGVRSISYDGKSINYGSDAELANAIADLEIRRNRQLGGIVTSYTRNATQLPRMGEISS